MKPLPGAIETCTSPYKNVAVSPETWAKLCGMKAATYSRSLDEVVTRLVDEKLRAQAAQMPLLLESARYEERGVIPTQTRLTSRRKR